MGTIQGKFVKAAESQELVVSLKPREENISGGGEWTVPAKVASRLDVMAIRWVGFESSSLRWWRQNPDFGG